MSLRPLTIRVDFPGKVIARTSLGDHVPADRYSC
jgi:hypothetical protein